MRVRTTSNNSAGKMTRVILKARGIVKNKLLQMAVQIYKRFVPDVFYTSNSWHGICLCAFGEESLMIQKPLSEVLYLSDLPPIPFFHPNQHL